MTSRHDSRIFGRRTFLRGAALTAAAAATAPLLESAAFAAATDPDQLFRHGEFAAAERGYRHQLRDNPENAHAAAQVGYIALLSNRFRVAESFLARAVSLDPADITARQRLAECHVRQDRHARAVPLLKQTGRSQDEAFATVYEHLGARPWRISGPESTRAPFFILDPVPGIEASINGGPAQKFLLDTYATLDLSPEAAEAAGLRALASITGGVVDNMPVVSYLGVLDSLRIGEIEIRGIPVQWTDAKRPTMPDGTPPAGVIGTTVFYHFLTTMDYAGRALILRRKTAAQQREVHAKAGRSRLPLWLAGDHYPCTLGSLGSQGPRMVTLDTGGIAHGFDTTVAIAEQAGFTVDHAHATSSNGATVYPATADRLSLGKAVVRDVTGMAVDRVFPGLPGPGQSERFGFDLTANFTHEFFKPFAITFDYTAMDFHITQGRTATARQ